MVHVGERQPRDVNSGFMKRQRINIFIFTYIV